MVNSNSILALIKNIKIIISLLKVDTYISALLKHGVLLDDA